MIGYMPQQALKNHLPERMKSASCLPVSKSMPTTRHSSIQPNISDRFTTKRRPVRYRQKRAGYSKADGNARRVVAPPAAETHCGKTMPSACAGLAAITVICNGGGGVPVGKADGYHGIEAVTTKICPPPCFLQPNSRRRAAHSDRCRTRCISTGASPPNARWRRLRRSCFVKCSSTPSDVARK